MIICPNCAWGNTAGSRFCENCGADLRSLSSGTPPTRDPWAPQAEGAAANWYPQMQTVAPVPQFEDAPETSGRRWWLWAIVGLMAVCLLVFIGFAFWSTSTDSGNDFLTRVAEEGTRQADEQD